MTSAGKQLIDMGEMIHRKKKLQQFTFYHFKH